MFKAKNLDIALPEGIPEIDHIAYDLWLLNVTLRFHSQREPFYIRFASVLGFRVLDEGDLAEFWSSEDRPSGVVWEIESGGWLDLERSRNGFISAQKVHKEFLLVGINDCVSVISSQAPECFGAKL